jgi:ATP-binding cassette subfamily C (CFTR/MRP) protein 1
LLVLICSIDLNIRQGSLFALVGMVGSGKSSILAALLGEMNKVHGHVSVSGTIAYVPQTAWIMNTTLRENILFGREFDKNLYDRVIEACALRQDLGELMSRRRLCYKNSKLVCRYASSKRSNRNW